MQLQEDSPAVHGAIHGAALSLDSFILNGIPCGVLQESAFPGFLEKLAGNLLRDLARLEQHVSGASQVESRQVLAALVEKCRQLIDLVSGLRSFRALPLDKLRTAVVQIPLLHEECAQLIQRLEACLRIPKPLYQPRAGHSTSATDDFLANLGKVFEEEWATSGTRS